MNKLLILTLLALGISHNSIAMDTDSTQNDLNILLLNAVKTSDVEKATQLLDAGADANAQDKYQTALAHAAGAGHTSICKLLLERGANANARKGNNTTALMEASKHVEICKLLLNHGARVNAQTGTVTALRAALIPPCDPKVVILLLENGAHLDPAYPHIMAPLYIAATSEKNDVCLEIIQYQKRINASIKTTLLCLKRLQKDSPCSALLYRQFNTLLKPHMKTYISMNELLTMRDYNNKRVYDYLPIDCLNPDKISDQSKYNLIWSWIPNCSIQ